VKAQLFAEFRPHHWIPPV